MTTSRVAGLAAGRDHSLALMADGAAWGWGGDGSGRAVLPALCSAAPPAGAVIVPSAPRLHRLSAGFGVSYGVTPQGSVYVWGASRSGLAGPKEALATMWPQQLGGLASIQAVAPGEFFGMALDHAGRMHSWGLARNAGAGMRNTPPVALPHTAAMTALSVGGGHVLALDATGRLHSWGNNGAGQLGHNDLQDKRSALPVKLERAVDTIAAGLTHSLAIDRDGGLWAWGSNQHGQLGHDAPPYSPHPMRVALPRPVRAIAAGMYFSLALDVDNQVHSWGWNGKGQLGREAGRASALPGLVQGLPPIRHLSAGQGHALASDGHTIYAWGDNAASQLGPHGPLAQSPAHPAWTADPVLLLS